MMTTCLFIDGHRTGSRKEDAMVSEGDGWDRQCGGHPPDASWPSTAFLGQLSEEARQAVLQLGTPKKFDPGDVVILEGTPSDCAFLLTAGIYKVTGSLGSGREALLAIRVAGDVVGELGLADGRPRSATVRASGPGYGRRIGERDFYTFLNRFEDANRASNRMMAAKLRSATRRRVEFAAFSAQARLARVLLELVVTHGMQSADGIVIVLDLTQPELAALVGSAEATVHRALSQLRRESVLDTGYRRIRVLDLGRLHELAEM